MSPAMAQVNFTTVASAKDMGKSDYVQIQYIVENAKQIENLEPPDFPYFTIVQGPSQSTVMSIVNGAMTQYKAVSYVLQPKHLGKLIIKGATATVDGHQMHSNPVTITVHNTGSSGNSQPPNNFNPLPDPGWPAREQQVDMEEVIKPGENVAEKIKKNFFVRVEVSKKDCYLGEPIVATYKLYSRLRSDSRVMKQPSLNGFSVYDMTDPNDDQSSVEKVNGKNFTVHIIRKAQLIALQAGDITLDPVEIDNDIYFMKLDLKPSSRGDQGIGSLLDRLFDQDQQGTPFTQHLTLDSKPFTVHVKPLPEAQKPADFNGAVGRYTMLASVDSKEIDTGDAAILTVTIKGTGNLPMVNAPIVEWLADMESYDVSSKENINNASVPLGGSKTFTYSFSCTKPGKYILPPVKLSYFDPEANAYKTVQTDPVHIVIHHAGKHKPLPVLTSSATGIAGGWGKNILWIISGILAGALGIYFLMQKKRTVKPTSAAVKTEPLADPAKPVEAPAPVKDPLLESKELFGTGDYGKFYTSVNRTIWKAVSDKLQLPASDLNKSNISAGLRSKGWDDEEIIQLKNLMNECEMKLYTPEYSSADVARTLEEAEVVIGRFG
jgi:hypothetical protein